MWGEFFKEIWKERRREERLQKKRDEHRGRTGSSWRGFWESWEKRREYFFWAEKLKLGERGGRSPASGFLEKLSGQVVLTTHRASSGAQIRVQKWRRRWFALSQSTNGDISGAKWKCRSYLGRSELSSMVLKVGGCTSKCWLHQPKFKHPTLFCEIYYKIIFW